MALPADNGKPMQEKKDNEMRIISVALEGADVQKEVMLNKPAPKENCIFGKI